MNELARAVDGPVVRWTMMVAAGVLVFGGGVVAGQLVQRRAPASAPVRAFDPCGLPAGVTMDGLAPADAAAVVTRAMRCRDVEAGRISAADYTRIERPLVVPEMTWSASVRGYSSQYSDASWSAQRALGAPDVFPAAGDQVNAWASQGADDRVEFLELGFERAQRLSAVDVYETYNPGAVGELELIGASGRHYVVHRAPAEATGQPARKRRFDFACTSEPIVAVRLTIDSPKVAGWNEIDAVGGQPCVEP